MHDDSILKKGGRINMDNKIAVLTNTYHGFTLDEALNGIAAAGSGM